MIPPQGVGAARRVVLDVDTGIDDALALLYAVAESRLDLVGVTAVVGNVPVDVAARNSAAVLAAARASGIPVVLGASATAEGLGHRSGPTNHGIDGLGGVAVPPPPPGTPSPEDPWALVDRLSRAAPVLVAACAPLCNVARYGSLPGVQEVVMVGGELAPAPEPEFNVAHDVASAERVLAAETPLTVYPADVFETVAVPSPLVDGLRGSRHAAARLAGELLAVRRRHLLGDAAAVVLLARPELFTVQRQRMALLEGQLVPHPSEGAGREVDVVVSADVAAVVDAFVRAVTKPPGPGRFAGYAAG